MDGIKLPPTPSDPAEAARWEHTRLRRRMLDGQWEQDVKQRINELVGTIRKEAWGHPDLSVTPFRSIARELSALYLTAPEVHHDAGPERIAPLVDALDAVSHWATMPRYQANVIGCREYLLRVSYADGRLLMRPVAPDMVVAEAHTDRPDTPVSIRELRLRRHPVSGSWAWTWDVLDISDPEAPVYEIREAGPTGPAEDWTTHYLGGVYSGDAYPYRRGDGTPVLPYTLYHAELTGDRLWDAWQGMETVEGSLNLAVLGTFGLHIARNASWPQRYAVNAAPVGAGAIDTDGPRRVEVITDPATLLVLETISQERDLQPQVGQWEAGADLESFLRAVDQYATRLALDAGVPPSDIQRLGGTARSGYAIALSNDGKRIAQRKFAPAFRRSDQDFLSLAAVMLNRFAGASLPEEGYTVVYQEIPLSPQELEAKRAHVLELLDRGMMSPIDAYRAFRPGLTPEQARQELAAIQQARALLKLTPM